MYVMSVSLSNYYLSSMITVNNTNLPNILQEAKTGALTNEECIQAMLERNPPDAEHIFNSSICFGSKDGGLPNGCFVRSSFTPYTVHITCNLLMKL